MEQGIKYSTLRDWPGKFKTGEQQGGAVWIEALKKERIQPLTQSGVEVRIGSYVVKIAQGFDSDVFLNVCRSLSALC